MKIQDLVLETRKVKWQDLKDLQPQNLKLPYHAEKTKKSIIEMGFANAIYVWQEPQTQDIYILDGHCRSDVLRELVNDGFDIPEELPCTFLDNTKIKTKAQAIQYLLRVFNIKRNPIDNDALEYWLKEVDLSFDDVSFDDLDIKIDIDEIEEDDIISINNNETDCKIVFKFDAMMYESVLQRIEAVKKEKSLATNEAVLLELLQK